MTPFAEYVLPDGLGRVQAEGLLAARLRLERGATESTERTYYDTFDGRLHAAGLELAEDETELAVLNGSGELARSRAPRHRTGSGIFAAQLPDGRLRELVAPLVEMRALTPL